MHLLLIRDSSPLRFGVRASETKNDKLFRQFSASRQEK